MKFLVQKTNLGFIPVFDSDRDKVREAKLKMGDIYEIDITKPRNPKFHKKFMALMNLCHENQEHFSHFNDTREHITIESGYYRNVEMPNGEIKKKALSISFASMDEIQFSNLYNKSINAVCDFLKVDNDTLLNEIINFM